MNPSRLLQLDDSGKPKEISHVRETTATVVPDSDENLPVLSQRQQTNNEHTVSISSLERIFGKGGIRYTVLSTECLLKTLPPDYPLNYAIDSFLTHLEYLEPFIQNEEAELNKLKNLQQSEQITALKDTQAELEQILSEQQKAWFLKSSYEKRLKPLRIQISAQLKALTTSCLEPQPHQEIDSAIPAYFKQLQKEISSLEKSIVEKKGIYKTLVLRAKDLIREYIQEFGKVPRTQRIQYLSNETVQTQHERIMQFKADQEEKETL